MKDKKIAIILPILGLIAAAIWALTDSHKNASTFEEHVALTSEIDFSKVAINKDLSLNFTVKAISEEDRKAVIYSHASNGISILSVGDILSEGNFRIEQIIASKIVLRDLKTADTYLVGVETEGKDQSVVRLSSLPDLTVKEAIGSVVVEK